MLFFATLALLVCPALHAATPPAGYENLERYIGRGLVTGHRSERAEIHRTLPLSCPPFHLRDEDGNIIDPTKDTEDKQTTVPVSTKQTCGACHDYDRITGGYHFQAGRGELYDEPAAGEGRSSSRSPGLYGKWQLLYQRELAPIEFDCTEDIDMTSYDWVNTCGICHPGGGPAEYDRANKRYDEVLESDRGMALFTYGDYHEADWVASGVVEADCFICHLDTYDYSTRAQQLKQLNYRWAATGAAGLGYVWGSVKADQQPKVYYRKTLFGPDGKVHLKIRRPADRQCTTCHDISGVQKRGTTWHSSYVQDVHTQRGVRCVDCHPGDIRHNFAKRHAAGLTIRTDLDRSMMSCKGCHETGEMGAPRYDHPGMPDLHFKRLSCAVCHMTKRPFLATRTVDTLTGKAVEIAIEPDANAYDSHAFGAQWGRLRRHEKDNFLDPFTAEEIAGALNYSVAPGDPIRMHFTPEDGTCCLPGEAFTVRSFLTKNSVAGSEDARVLMLLLLDRTGQDGATCVVRGNACQMDAAGRLVTLDTELAPRRPGATIAEWPLTYARNPKTGKIVPEAYQLGAFWAYRDNGIIRPLFLKDMRAAWDYINSEEFRFYECSGSPNASSEEMAALRKRLEIHDDNNDSWPEANTDDEIALVAWALTRTLTRVDHPELYYIKGATARKVSIEDVPDPYAGPLEDVPPLFEGRPFVAVDRYEWQRSVRNWEYHWRWEYAETRLSRMFTANIERVSLDKNPAVAQLAQRLSWSVSHGVEPASQALGAHGCADCHSRDSQFFFGKVTVDPFGRYAKPVTVPNHEILGYRLDGIEMGAWREQVLKPRVPHIVLGLLGILLIHFVLFGVHQRTSGYPEPDITRFRLYERIAHLAAMAAVMFLTLTGFCFLLGKSDPLGACARHAHTAAGSAALIGVALIFLSWFFRMLPAKGDIIWILCGGGYLGGRHRRLPAGKFNGGQKALFWLVIALIAVLGVTGLRMADLAEEAGPGVDPNPLMPLLYTAHDVAALLLILALICHIYLGAVLNPQCLKSLFGGKVSAQWAKEHHPDWYFRQ